MAIFTGTWRDTADLPFDPQAKVLHATPAGGVAAVRRHAISPHPAHQAFTRVGRKSRDTWQDMLSSADRTDWAAIGTTGPSRRGSTARTPAGGYITFSALTWIDIHATDATDRTGPETHYNDYITATLDSLNVAAQQLTFSVTYNAEVAQDLHAAVAAYQVNPAYRNAANPHRQTRLVDLHPLPQAPPFAQTRTVSTAWPLAAGDTLRLYVRGRVSNYYQFQALLSRVA